MFRPLPNPPACLRPWRHELASLSFYADAALFSEQPDAMHLVSIRLSNARENSAENRLKKHSKQEGRRWHRSRIGQPLLTPFLLPLPLQPSALLPRLPHAITGFDLGFSGCYNDKRNYKYL